MNPVTDVAMAAAYFMASVGMVGLADCIHRKKWRDIWAPLLMVAMCGTFIWTH